LTKDAGNITAAELPTLIIFFTNLWIIGLKELLML